MPAFQREGHEVLLGGLIITGLFIVAVGLFLIEPILASFSDDDVIYAVLPEAPKLTVGSPVWIGGKEVGAVTDVAFMPFEGDSTARVAITIEFPHEYHEQLRRDSHIRLTSAQMIGSPVVDISPGTAGAPPLQHGDTLYMDNYVTIPSLRAKAVLVKAHLDTVLTAVQALAEPVGDRMASLDPVMRNMAGAQRELASLAEGFRTGPAAALMSDGQFAARLAELQKTVAALGPAFGEARARFTDPASGVGSSLGRMQENASRLSASLEQLQAMMVANNGTLYRLGADSALMKTLHTTQAQLDSLIAEAKKNPLPFVF